MSSGMNNITAFTSDGLIGKDNSATYYVHWDKSYLYLGWIGGRTNYSSDLFYAAIDTDPTGSIGTTSAIEGVGFLVERPDY